MSIRDNYIICVFLIIMCIHDINCMGIAINLCSRDTYMFRDTYFVVNKWALPFSNHIDDVTLHKLSKSQPAYVCISMFVCTHAIQ